MLKPHELDVADKNMLSSWFPCSAESGEGVNKAIDALLLNQAVARHNMSMPVGALNYM